MVLSIIIIITVLFLIALLSSSRRMLGLYHHLQHFLHHPSSHWFWSTSSFRSTAFHPSQLVLALLSLYQPLNAFPLHL